VKLVDAHCHLDFEAFADDREAVIARARDAGVEHIVIPGVKAGDWQRIEHLCSRPGLHACYGLHPYYVDQHTISDLDKLDRQLGEHSCVALGECGLDYRDGQADKAQQLRFFTAQLELAQQHEKPLVIHSVRATEDVIVKLKNQPKLRGMIHSYSGSLEQAMQLIENGFYISLGGSVTYERAKRLHKVAAGIPLESILLETDAPDQPDTRHNGERNEPAYLINTLNFIAQLRNESAENIAEQTTANASRLFNL
jgi:TatD DNase family protein